MGQAGWRMFLSIWVCFLVYPAIGTLSGPGTVCSGDTVTLTCNITGATVLEWLFGNTVIVQLNTGDGLFQLGDRAAINRSELQFSFSILANSPQFVSQLRFTPGDNRISLGVEVTCAEGVGSSGLFRQTASTAVAAIVPAPDDVRLTDFVNGTTNSTVTIQWTPLPDAGNRNYVIVVSPVPVSGLVMESSSPSTNTTLLYNTNYTINISLDAPCAESATTTFALVGCEVPSVSSGVQLNISSANEGAEIMYECMPGFQATAEVPGFQPQETITAVCGSNGLWTPDPAQYECIVDCGVPTFPPNSNISEVTNTTEGATLIIQCEEGFNPDSITSQCVDIGGAGMWRPDPTTLQCMIKDGTVTTAGRVSSRAMTTSTSSSPLATNDTETRSGPPVSTIVGVVVVVVVLVATAIAIIFIVICVLKHKRSVVINKNGIKHEGMELQEATPEHMAEYHTLHSRGFNIDQDYSTVHHSSHVAKTGNGTEYSEVKSDSKLQRNIHKANIQVGGAAEYSQLNTNPVGDAAEYSQLNTKPTPPTSGLVYADVGSAMSKKKVKETGAPQFQHIPEDKVMYSAIDVKATAALKKEKEKENVKVPVCDLDMMLIQVKKEVSPLWHEYGEVLAVPEKVLKDVKDMEVDNSDKLMEILDFWFRKFPPGGGPTWTEVAASIKEIGLTELADKLVKVDTTGELPIKVSTKVEALAMKEATPPPLPPKIDSDQEALLPPRPKPRSGSLKQAPPRPPKAGTQTLPTAIPPRPPKTHHSQPPHSQPEELPARPPKPGPT